MPIQIIIFLMKTKIFACEINSNGKAESISIKGNSEIKCEGKESIDELIECLYDAFNIDDFSDDNFDIVIVESGADREVIKYLDEKCAGASKFNMISMEKVLPFIATNKNLVNAEDEVVLIFSDQFYKIACNENGIVKIGKARKTEEAVALTENDFACLYYFISNSVAAGVDESKLEEAKEEIVALQRKLNHYKTELEELREVQKQFIALQESQNKQEEEKEQADAIYKKAKKYADDELYDKAFEFYQKAADMGSIDAIGSLGWCYLTANGVKKDVKKAFEYSFEAAEQGNSIGQNCLALLYENGEGVKKNVVKAAEFFQLAAEQGHRVAQYHLGRLYEDGTGVAQDYTQAVKLYQQSAEQGLAMAQSSLGYMYDKGRGVKKDYAQALNWYKKAAAQEDPRGQNNLGSMYYDGRGVKQDYDEAFKWFSRAAEKGWSTAQSNLGLCYEEGHGVEEDWKKARDWYKKAADQGNKFAKKQLEDYF